MPQNRASWWIATCAALTTLNAGAEDVPDATRVVRGAEVVAGPTLGVPVDVDLRELPIVPAWKPGDPIRDIPRRTSGEGRPVWHTPPRLDPLVERQRKAGRGVTTSTQVHNFEGNSSTLNPNDPTGDVGQEYFVEAINAPVGTAITIYRKSDATLAAGPFALDTLGASGFCGDGFGDPVVLYDHLAGRWFLSEFSNFGNRLCVYTSRTDDPVVGGWCFYEIADSSFPDYPKYGVWPDFYLGTANQGSSPPVYALDRINMLSPDGSSCPTARSPQKLVAPGLPGLDFQAFTPGDLDGPAPPAGSPAYLMRHRDEELHGDPDPSPTTDLLEIWALDVDFDSDQNTTLTQLLDVVVADFDSNLCPPIDEFSCIPQPDGGPPLDPLLEVIMNRLSYRNFGSHETIVGVLQTDVGDFADHSGERWFELRKVGGGDWTLFQEGTYSPDAEHRFMGTIAMDSNGGILLAYNVSSTSVYPSLRYTGRVASDPAGVMSLAETTLATGGSDNSSFRYGDYNQMGIDPVDGCTFWLLGMYNPAGKGVRIGAVRLDACLAAVFTDGFESGDVSAWSHSLGG